jgi:hypothetical protein
VERVSDLPLSASDGERGQYWIPSPALQQSSVAPATANSIMMTIATTTTMIPHDD